MESWRAILSNPNRPAIESRAAGAYLYGDTAFVICYETVGEAWLAATNVFVREAESHQPCLVRTFPDEFASEGTGRLSGRRAS